MEDTPKGKKIGRNDPCTCGSGLKYKKCCWKQGIVWYKLPDEQFEKEREQVEREKELEMAITGHECGYYLRHIQALDKKSGKRVRALCSRMFFREPQETFHEFLMWIMRTTIGKEWAEGQEAKKPEGWHFIFKCNKKYSEWTKKNRDQGEFEKTGRYSGLPDGYTQWLLCLAFDLYCLQHTKQLPESLLSRLRQDGHEFQGARYEIAVAAIFARAGFEIEFFDEKDPAVIQKTHCEFIATDPKTGVKIAVEAKSKHRPGILHDEREIEADKRYLKGDVHDLLRNAMEKDIGDIPYMIFVDLNAKHTPGLDFKDKPWLKDIFRIIPNNTQGSQEGKANLIAITNFSYHYQGEGRAEQSESLYSLAMKPTHPLPEDTTNKLVHVINKYGAVPDLDMVVGKFNHS